VTNLGRSVLNTIVSDLALQATWGSAGGTPIAAPRIGLYRPWQPSMDEGWTRWLMERYDFAFTNVYNADIIAGALRQRYDVIVIADIGSNTILDGYAKGALPPRYAGGIGREGVRALDAFVRAGGTLVTLNNSTMFAVNELHLPVENVIADIERDEFFMSGSLVSMQVDPSHPVMSGMPENGKIFVGRSPVFTVTDDFEGTVLAKYPEAGSPLLSGYLLGEEHLQGYAAALDVHHGDGHVILLAMRPQWRGQPFGNFRILFNAALYSAQLAGAAPDNSAFWTKPTPAAADSTQVQ
jgi:ribosomal protein S18 acetylase RimI-like enzyme